MNLRAPGRQLHKHSMRSAILALTIGSMVFALVLLTVLFGLASRQQIRDVTMEDNDQTLVRMQRELNDEVHSIFIRMTSIYSESEFVDSMRNPAADWSNLQPYYWFAWKLANARYSGTDSPEAIYIYDSSDRLISCYRRIVYLYPRDIYEASGMDTNTERVQQYLSGDTTDLFISGYYNRAADKDLVRFVLKLHDYDSGRRTFGYLVCDFDSSLFTNIISKYIASDGVIAWLQPAGDRAVAVSGLAGEQARTNHTALLAAIRGMKSTEELSASGLLGKDWPGCYLNANLDSAYGLNEFMLTSQSLALETQQALVRSLFLIMLLMLVLTSFLAAILSSRIARPLEQMRDTIVRIKGGETALRVSPAGWSEELELLGTEFNDMLDRIQNMIKQEYEARLLVERTEYKALQAQINPHFLYNTLDTMAGIANAQDCVLVSGLCQSLSAIFRYSLDISDDLSTMQKEMAHVRNYLYVMDVRNGNSVRCEFEIAPDTLQDAVPRITIQPIVENALSHGLRSSRRKDKCLRISAVHGANPLVRETGGTGSCPPAENCLIITVEDNGIGMDARSLNEELARADLHRVEIGRSIGVLNVNARIRQAFGPCYGIRIDSVEGEGTRVYIVIPGRKGEPSTE